eukprot:symbB.v1.2.022676.t1/scaffold1992.1/size93445/7
MLRNLETANALVPLASPCMERLVNGNSKAELATGLLSQEELYDNFRNAVRVLGPLTMQDEKEEPKDFFQQPIPQEEWLE